MFHFVVNNQEALSPWFAFPAAVVLMGVYYVLGSPARRARRQSKKVM